MSFRVNPQVESMQKTRMFITPGLSLYDEKILKEITNMGQNVQGQ